MSDNFVSRWSRQKLASAQPAKSDQPAEEAPTAEPIAETPAAGPIEPTPVEPAMTEEEVAALPPVEQLHAGSDITAFLKKGVPLALKNAALRRMWAVDPSIRDFIGEARDYAWDWNVPGGVPVSGPLTPTTDVSGLLRRIFGEDPESSPPPENTGHAVEKIAEPAPVRAPEAPRPPTAPNADVVIEETPDEDEAEVPRPRRHGSALPT